MNAFKTIKKVGIVLVSFGLLFYTGTQLYAKISSNVSGKVLDEETGLPVKGVKVYLKYGYNWTETDEKGEFIFRDAKQGINYIAFYPPPPYAWEKWEKELHPITIKPGKIYYMIKKLRIGGTLKLKVYDQTTSVPIAGVDVHIKRINFKMQEENDETDENGIYSIGQLAAEKYEMTLRKDGWWMKTLSDVEIRENQTTAVDEPYDSSSPTKIEGYVKCKGTGQPLADIEVNVERKGKHGWADTYTDENGYFSMLDMEEGTFEICVFQIIEVNGKTDTTPICKIYQVIKNKTISITFYLDCAYNYTKRRNE
jgi:5-hydroxyisourate hydrolase-like protein (transthyretin family)